MAALARTQTVGEVVQAMIAELRNVGGGGSAPAAHSGGRSRAERRRRRRRRRFGRVC